MHTRMLFYRICHKVMVVIWAKLLPVLDTVWKGRDGPRCSTATLQECLLPPLRLWEGRQKMHFHILMRRILFFAYNNALS